MWSLICSHYVDSSTQLGVSSSPSRHLVEIVGSMLAEGWVKTNSDGSVLNHSLAVYGGVLRDSFGGFIRGFSANLGHHTVTITKVWGVLYALKMAWSLVFIMF